MSPGICDVCGQPAEVHLTEIRSDVKQERHLCIEHARAEGLPVPSQSGAACSMNGVAYGTIAEAMEGGISDNLRGTLNFARAHARMPASVEELAQGMAMGPEAAASGPPFTGDLAEQLEGIERMIREAEERGRG